MGDVSNTFFATGSAITGSPGDIVTIGPDGQPLATSAAALQAASLQVSGEVDATRIESNAIVWVDGVNETSVPKTHADALASANTPSAENPVATMADVGGSDLTADQLAGIQEATGMDATHPPIIEGDTRLTDTRDPRMHGVNQHEGIVVGAAQVSTPKTYIGTLVALNSLEVPVAADALNIVDALSIPAAFPPDAITPQGRLTVPPCFSQTGSGAAFQMNGANPQIKISYIPEATYQATHHSLYITAVGGAGTVNCSVYADNAGAVGSLLQDLGTFSVTGTGWLRNTHAAAFQHYWRTKVHIVWSRVTGDFSVLVKKLSTSAHTEFPDGCVCKTSANAGVAWAQATQTVGAIVCDAFLNVVWHSTTNHASSLVYGRAPGQLVALYDGSSAWALATIPIAGVTLDCEALTAATYYNVFLYLNATTLTLEAATTALVLQDCISVKSGATPRRDVGYIAPVTIVSTHQGPCDVNDGRLTRNVYNLIKKRVTKNPRYTGATRMTMGGDTNWHKTFDNDDLTALFISRDEIIRVGAWNGGTLIMSYLYLPSCAVGIDAVAPYVAEAARGANGASSNLLVGAIAVAFDAAISQGVHSLYFLLKANTSQAMYWDAVTYYTPFTATSHLDTWLDC